MPTVFDDRRRSVDAALRRQALAILVWGSGSGPGRDFEKRVEIRDTLQAEFTESDVRFSEELMPDTPGAVDLTDAEREEFHLAWCDLCVVLDTSQGPGEEIAYFAETPVNYKFRIFTHERYRGSGSFPAAVRRGLRQFFYTEEEFATCSVVARIVDLVKKAALRKALPSLRSDPF